MELAKVFNGSAARDPLPDCVAALALADLANLDWTDPALGLHGCGWWPIEDQSPALDPGETYGDEVLTVDAAHQIVIAVRAVVIPPAGPVVPQRVPMLNAHLVLIETGWMPLIDSFIDNMPENARSKARAYLTQAETMARDNELVLAIPAALGKTEAEVDQLFITAGALNV